MNTTAIEQAIEQLSLEERLQLIERTLNKMYSSTQTSLTKAEIDNRFEDIVKGKAQLENVTELINRLKKQYLV